MTHVSREPIFRLGRIVVTLTACERLVAEDIPPALYRHQSGDWGHLTEAEVIDNEESVLKDRDINSAYYDRNGTEFAVMTFPDRSKTLVYLREDDQ
jgi:hypothetical protein